MYANPFAYKRPLQPGQDDLITISRKTLMAKTISGLEFGNWYVVSGGKKIGKTSFLLSLIHECEMRQLGYQFVLIKPEELAQPQLDEWCRLLRRRLQALYPAAASVERAGAAPDLHQLKNTMVEVAKQLAPNGKIIFILDGVETFPKVLIHEIFRILLHLQQSRATDAQLSRFQFMISGMLGTNDLQIDPGHSFGEYAMRAQVEDFRCEDIEEMLRRVAHHLRLPLATGFARMLYEATSGTGYLAQKICYRILETAFVRQEPPGFSLQNAEAAIDSIVKEGDTNVEMVMTQIEKDHQLVECLRHNMQLGTVSTSKFDPNSKTLVALGALAEHNGFYRVRNRIYEAAFHDYFTVERLANLYSSPQDHQRTRELLSKAVHELEEVKDNLNALTGNLHMISGNLERGNILRSINEAFMNIVDNTKSCSLMLQDHGSGFLHIADAIGLSQDEMSSFTLRVGQGIAGWVAQVGRTRVVSDVTDEIECPDFTGREIALKYNLGAMACLPLKAAGQILGVINLALGKPRQFTGSEIKMLESLAAYAALALQNTEMHLDLQRYFDELAEVRLLLQEAGKHTELDSISHKILRLAGEITGTEHAYMVYRKPGEEDWRFRFAENAPEPLPQRPEIENGEGIAGHVIKTGLPLYLDNVESVDSGASFRYFALWEDLRWELAVPGLVDNEPHGCLVVAGSTATILRPAQMQLLSLLADAIAITHRNKRLFGIAEKKTQEVMSANSIGEALSHENSMQEILNLIASECLNVVGRENKVALVWIKDSERGKLILKAADGEAFAHELLGRSLSIYQRSLVAWVLNHGEPRLAKDVRRDAYYRPTHPAIKSELAIPLVFRDETIGVIDLQSLCLDDFSEQDQEALTAVAHNAAVAHKIGELCDVRVKELEALYRIGTKINAHRNVKGVLGTICREGLKAIGKDKRNFSVTLVNPETGEFLLRETRGLNAGAEKKLFEFWDERTREGWVLKNKTHYLCADTASPEALYTPTGPQIKSALFVPILFDRHALGVITMESVIEDDFGEADLRLLKGIANEAGVAIANARLSEELANAQIGLTKALDTAIIDETIAGFTHDIKNFSSMIAGETQWLEKRERDHKLNVEALNSAIRSINAYVKKIEDFANFLKSRAYKFPPEMSWCPLHSVMEEAVQWVAARARRQEVDIRTDEASLTLPLYADPGRLARAFFNVMSNALDAMPDGGTLRIGAECHEGWVRILFSDSGTGISEEILNEVLRPFFTTKEKGYGLGLALTKRIVEADHHGKLILQSTPGHGTTVVVNLPLEWEGPTPRGKKSPEKTQTGAPPQKVSRKPRGNVLVINDDTDMLAKIMQLLSGEGHKVTGTESGTKAVECCLQNDFDVIVSDFHLRKDYTATQTAIDFVPAFKKNSPATPIILTSASLDQLGFPEMYCDFFLEINTSFWEKILALVDQCLLLKSTIIQRSATKTFGE